MTLPFVHKYRPSKYPWLKEKEANCTLKSENQFERHQMGFNGEHVAVHMLKKLKYKGIRTTRHTDHLDAETSSTVWEIKSFGGGSIHKQMGIKRSQRIEKEKEAKKKKKKMKSMLNIFWNGDVDVFVKDGFGKFRPGGMTHVGTIKNYKKTIGLGRQQRLATTEEREKRRPKEKYKGAAKRKIIYSSYSSKKKEYETFIKQRDKLPKDLKPFVTPHSYKEYKNMGTKVYLSQNQKSGYGITSDKEIISLFSHRGAGQGAQAIENAVKNGGTHLWCFDGKLPGFYKGYGFEEIKKDRLKWNDDYAPENWDYEKFGRPDVLHLKIKKKRSSSKSWLRLHPNLTSSQRSLQISLGFALNALSVGISKEIERVRHSRKEYQQK